MAEIKFEEVTTMSSMNFTRLTIGILILIGLLFFKPLAYFVGIMMIFSGFNRDLFIRKTL